MLQKSTLILPTKQSKNGGPKIQINSTEQQYKQLQMLENKPDYISKVVIIGDSGTGKTCIAVRLCNLKYDNQSTVSVDLLTLMAVNKEKQRMKIQIWDTAGQQRYRTITNNYLKGADLVIFVYSIVNPASFENLDKWVQGLLKVSNKRFDVIFVANKIDFDEEYSIGQERENQLKKFIQTLGVEQLNLMMVSAKTGKNFDQLKKKLIQLLYRKKKSEGELGQRPIYLSVSNSNITSKNQKRRVRKAMENSCC